MRSDLRKSRSKTARAAWGRGLGGCGVSTCDRDLGGRSKRAGVRWGNAGDLTNKESVAW